MNKDSEFEDLIRRNFGDNNTRWRADEPQEFGVLSAFDRADEIDDWRPPEPAPLRWETNVASISTVVAILGLFLGLGSVWLPLSWSWLRWLGLLATCVGLMGLLWIAMRRRGDPEDEIPRL